MTAFSGPRALLSLALKIDMPGHAVRLSDAGEVDWDGSRYAPVDDVLGTITGYEDFTAGEEDLAPSIEVVWTPKNIAAAVALSQPSTQGSPMEWSVLQVDYDTNAVLHAHTFFYGIIDTTELNVDDNTYELRMGFITDMDRLLNIDKGNRLNRSFHRSVWPGETGLDMMTGTTTPVPWGDPQRQRSGVAVGGGGGFGGRMALR